MKRRGFTLLETLFAMIILSSGILLLSNSWSGNYMRVKKLKFAEEISSLLQQKVTEMEMEYRNKVAELPEDAHGDFGSDLPEYTWAMESKELELPDLSALLTARKGGADEMLLMVVKTMTEYINKAVKEVKITIIAKIGKREMKFPVTTYFVDYSKELEIPGMGGGGTPGGGLPATPPKGGKTQ